MSNRFGSFEALEPLGAGSSGTVYRARDTASGKLAALKVLDRDDPVPRALFQQEFRTLSRLDHPGLVRGLASGIEAGRLWLAMELVDGPEVPDGGRQDLAALVAILAPLCRTLDYLHGLGLVHGDLKPQNLRFDGQGQLKLLDLGFLGPAGSPGRRRGTPEYMAPEVIRGYPLDPRSDLYALGVIAYRLLAGRPPFEGHGALALLASQLAQIPESLQELRGDLPAEATRSIMRCLAKDPADRPRSARELLLALGAEGAETQGYLLFGSDLFGRDDQVARLFAGVQQQLAGGGSAARLAGAAGEGKSRLLQAISARAREEGHTVLEIAGGGEAPFHVVADLVGACEPLLVERGLDVRDARRQPLCALNRAWGEPPPPLEPRNEEARLRQAVDLLLSDLAAGTGLVVAVDDWDLADRATRDLLEPLLARPSEHKVTWVLATRPAAAEGKREPAPAGAAYDVALGPLDASATAALLETALGQPAPEALAEAVSRIAEGNPARIRVLVEHWRSTGRLRFEGGTWSFDYRGTGDLPPTIGMEAAVVLERLSPEGARCAGLAAILGHEVALSDLCGLDASEGLFDALADLERGGVLFRAGADPGRYRFAAALREAILAAMPAGDAEAWHAAAARWLDSRPDRESRIRAAFHHLGAGPAGDVGTVLSAAREAFGSGAMGTAAALLEGLGSRDLSPADAAEAARLRGDVLRLRAQGQEALAAYEEAIATWRALADRGADLSRDLVSAARAAMMVSAYDRARGFLDAALEACRQYGERQQEARALITFGRLEYFEGRSDRAWEYSEASVRLARDGGERSLEADALAFQGVIASPGDPTGREKLERAAALHRELCNPIGLMDALTNLGDRLHAAGDLARSREVFEEALAVARQAGAQVQEPLILLNLAEVALEQGGVRSALEAARRGFALAEGAGRPYPAGYALMLEALASLALGDYGAAREASAGAISRAERAGNRYLATAAHLARGQVALELGDLAVAAEAIDVAADLAESRSDAVSATKAAWLRGRFLVAIGEWDEAEDVLASASRAAAQNAAKMDALRIDHARGYLALRRGDLPEARHLAQACLEGASAMGAAMLAGEAQWLLGAAARRTGDEAAAQVAFAAGERYATEAGTPLLLGLCETGLAELGVPGHLAAEYRRKGGDRLRTLRSYAGGDGFYRWPERGTEATDAGSATLVAEALGAIKQMYEAESLTDLLGRLLARLVPLVRAERGAILAFKDRQVVECSITGGMSRDEALGTPGLDQAMWDLHPIFEEGRWLLPCAGADTLSAVIVLEGASLAGREWLPSFAEAVDLAVSQFMGWQDVEDRVDRLSFAQSLSRAALSGAGATEILRQALGEVLERTGADRVFALEAGEGGSVEMRLGLDSHGAELPPGTPLSRSICQWVLSNGEAVRLLDAQEMEGWQQQQSILALGLRTIAAVPLREGEAVRGVLYMDSENIMATFGPREQALLEAAAEIVSPLLRKV